MLLTYRYSQLEKIGTNLDGHFEVHEKYSNNGPHSLQSKFILCQGANTIFGQSIICDYLQGYI